ncbi:MAG: carboxypeptidase-like regulatory domain-containing protein [Thermofilum sp.]|uniref:MSCRAMM family protein n=1 Tax=Thermofilum sp. TaxID=1961369 RepID=UPI00315E24A6
MSRKYLLGIIALVAILALTLQAYAAPTFPAHRAWNVLQYPNGQPFENQNVIIVYFNETGNCLLAYAVGTTNSAGNITLTIAQPGGVINTPNTGTSYNMSVFWQVYGKTFLVYSTRTNALNLLNSTIQLTNMMNFTFQALTTIGGQQVPLYFADPEVSGRKDIAYFQVYLYNKNGPQLLAVEGDNNAISNGSVVVPLVEVNIKPTLTPNCYHIESQKNVALYKEVYWLLDQGGGQKLKIMVGKENVTFSLSGTTLTANVKDLADGTTSPQTFDIVNDWGKKPLNDVAHTFLAQVVVTDPCGNPISNWEYPPIGIEFTSPTYGKLRVGKAFPNGTAPEEGYQLSGHYYFWLPNISLFYNEKMGIAAEIGGIQVFAEAFNTTKPQSVTYNKPFTFQPLTVSTSNGIVTLTIKASIVKTQITIKTSGLVAVQPLQGAIVQISPRVFDPNTYTDANGQVALMPFQIVGGGTTTSGTPIITRKGTSPGYLPVPYGLWSTGKLYTYTINVLWALPGTENFVDVTPDQNTIPLNLTKAIVQCSVQSFNLSAKVYAVNFKAVDLCGRPLTSADDPNATFILTYKSTDGTTINFPAGLGPNGTTFMAFVPGGTFTVSLFFKGVRMDPVSGPNPLVVSGNIGNISKATYTFPVGDLILRITPWDVKEPLVNVSVLLEYFKAGARTYYEGPKLTDCEGKVTFTKVPFVVGPNNLVTVTIKTTPYTPYIRHPKDDGLLIGKWNLTGLLKGISPGCTVGPIDVPTWVFSFTLEAVDHNGNILKELPTSNGAAPVIVAINDTYTKNEYNVTQVCQGGPGCLCWPLINVNYKIFNTTKSGPAGPWNNGLSEARFKVTGTQWANSNYPHLFIAGANYSFVVWYGGVMVYNYNFTLPRPSEMLDYSKVITAQVILYNETSGNMTLQKTDSLAYTWLLASGGRIEHPIVRFYAAPAYSGQYSNKLQLVTWVVNLDIYTLTKAGGGLVPGLNVTLIRNDAVNWKTQLKGDLYANITVPTEYTKSASMSYAWSAVTGQDGKASLPIAIWVPKASVRPSGIKFGASITNVYVLAGKKYGTPSVPDTPSYMTITGIGTLYGYNVGPYNMTLLTIYNDVSQSPDWYKQYGGSWVGPFRGPKAWIGANWNMTLWSGAAKVVYTTAMEGVCLQVVGPDFRDNMIPLANQPVTLTVYGSTGATATVASGSTGNDGTFPVYPDKGSTVATPVGSKTVFTGKLVFLGISGLSYEGSTTLNLDAALGLKNYGLDTGKAFDPDTLEQKISFTLDNNMPGGTCVTLEWDAIKVTVFDWSGKPLKNMMVAAILREPRAKAIPSVAGFTAENGSVILYVPPSEENKYQLLVYWRDSYLLRLAGKIPREIVIFDTVTDYDTPRTYKPGSGTTLETFVYVGIVMLKNAQGQALSPDILNKITVEIQWPDQVVTTHKPENDGRVPIILNKNTAKSWPLDASANRSPDTDPRDISQAPLGAYKVTVNLAGVGTLAQQTIKIEKGRFETSTQIFEVRLDIFDVKLTFVSPFGTPLANAKVTITKPDGTTVSDTLDASGSIVVKEVPPGNLQYTVAEWNGLPVQFSGSVARAGEIGVTVTKIGKLTVKVLGARGQGIDGATVAVEKVGTFTTDASGVVSLELPSGSYGVTASKGGRTASATATVTDGKETVTELKLDIFLTLAGWEMSSNEFLGLILLLVLLVLVLFIIAHEYAVYRRRRLAKVIAPAEGTQVK